MGSGDDGVWCGQWVVGNGNGGVWCGGQWWAVVKMVFGVVVGGGQW